MSKLTGKILLALLFALSVYTLICFSLLKAKSTATADLYKKKSLLVKQTAAPRIILIGGSNVLYGIDSDALGMRLGLPVVNMGLNADLGLKFMLEFSKVYLQPGDSVILSPEYEHLYDKNNYYGTFKLIDLLIDNPGSTAYINSREQMFHLLLMAPTSLASRAIYGTTSYDPPISARGDFLWDEISLQNKVKLPKPGIADNKGLNRDIFADLLSYKELLLSRKIQLYVSFPYIPSDALAVNRGTVDRLSQQLTAAGFAVLAPPEACTVSSHYFYDTTYHLNAVGRILRTEQLAAQLGAVTH